MDAHVQTIIEVIGFLITFAAFVWKVSSDRKTDMEIMDAKVGRVYGRLDEVKKGFEDKVEYCREDAEGKFVATKVCKVLHDTTDQNFQRLDRKVDTLGEKIDKIYELLQSQK